MATKKKTTVLCFANNKGGSGKSTSCANVGYALAQQGKRVLLLDGDMQLNLSLSFFPEEEVLAMAQGEKNLYHAIRGQQFTAVQAMGEAMTVQWTDDMWEDYNRAVSADRERLIRMWGNPG